MVKALRFKGDKKVKKRKRTTTAADDAADSGAEDAAGPSVKKLAPDREGDDTITTTASASASTAKDDNDDDDEGWVDADCLEDINGPLVFAIAAPTPLGLSCDPTTGQTFTSALSAGDHTLATAQPTGVHQVWVATRIHGSSSAEKRSFKSAHGKYLSCDKVGVLSATREAIGAEEEFEVSLLPGVGGRWALATVRGGFVGAHETGGGGGGKAVVRGDGEKVGFGEEWVVRVQRRNKKKRRGGDQGRVKDRVTRKELEELAGIKLDDDQVKVLRKARKEGGFHEALLDMRVKHGKHDKFAY
ncbi:FRG1-like family-domain-containing protein [Morchella snyderi]|nr:FRG1-like family-domain-containing protein [Morchella snyderi]